MGWDSWQGTGFGGRRRRRSRRRGDSGFTPGAAVVACVAAAVVIAAAFGARHLLSAREAAAGAAENTNCTLIVPAAPLTAQGLATPYQLTATNPADGPCDEANPDQTAFVQGAVLNPRTGRISVYDPVVVDQGARPAAAPVVPALPSGAVVAVWFGFNGGTLTLAGADQAPPVTGSGSPGAGSPGTTGSPGADAGMGSPGAGSSSSGSPAAGAGSPGAGAGSPGSGTAGSPGTGSGAGAGSPAPPPDGPAASAVADPVLQGAGCVAGQESGGQFSSFTQVGACNATAFFKAANAAIAAGRLRVPPPGRGTDGLRCPTTRSFALIDQDQSDNVTTEYLATGGGQVAQDTAANRQALTGAATLSNGSDNGLLDLFVDPALGCAPWKAPDLSDNGDSATALPLDELQAAAYAGRARAGGPAALVPLSDPMTLDDAGNTSAAKTDTYRSLVDMPPLPAGQTPGQYCADMERYGGIRLQQDVNLLAGGQSPMPGAADSLFTFLGMRLQQSFANLGCGGHGMRNDVTTTADANGVVVAVCFARQAAPVTRGRGNPTAGMTTCPPSAGPSATATPSAGTGPGSPPAASGSPVPTAGSPAPTAASPAPPVRYRHRHRRHW